ncbi:hypothetical protein DDI_0215 [Dickeya dianthicola RNS04.9]|nr:hypothetical protein DDI_0215 [Dickeya dianthicola RNS04.9]
MSVQNAGIITIDYFERMPQADFSPPTTRVTSPARRSMSMAG